jgi:RHS repeat-associated protein
VTFSHGTIENPIIQGIQIVPSTAPPPPPPTAATYTYNATGLRKTKTNSTGIVTGFTWAQATDLPMLLAQSVSGTTNSFIYGPGGLPVEQIDTTGGTNTVRYLHHDQLGSTRLVTDSAGSTVSTYTYDPYGKLSGSTGTFVTPLGFAGQYTDAETGFQYLRARYYDPATGQFLTRDPIEPLNRDAYGYVNRDPLTSTDASGLCGPFCAVIVAFAVGFTIDVGIQALSNVMAGCSPFDDIDWKRAAFWGAVSAATAGFGRWLQGLSAADRAAFDYATAANKLDHIFAAKHNLDPLVQQFGSRQAAVREILNALKGLTPASGTFEETVAVGGQDVVVRGAVVDGVVKIGTAFTP